MKWMKVTVEGIVVADGQGQGQNSTYPQVYRSIDKIIDLLFLLRNNNYVRTNCNKFVIYSNNIIDQYDI